MGKHTPGPWRYAEIRRPPIGNFNAPTDADGMVFWGYSISGSSEHGGPILPTLGNVHNFPDNMEANAKLIAAAPDMLEALRNIAFARPLGELPNSKWGKLIEKLERFAVDALRKAEGG